MNNPKLGVYGGGSWGSAIAVALARANFNVPITLYIRDDNAVQEILNSRTNSKYLRGVTLPSNVHPTNRAEDILELDLLVIAVPSSAFLETIELLKQYRISTSTLLTIATKGLVYDNNKVYLLSDIVASRIMNKLLFIAGPNFALELANNMKTAMTIACKDLSIAQLVANIIQSSHLITETTTDIITIQIAGVIKNIIAIQSGIEIAQNAGKNSKAWLITQGLKEIMLLSTALGGKIDSTLQAAVVGDLILTCSSTDSRNTKFGYEIYNELDKKRFIKEYPILVEGLKALPLVLELAKIHKVTLPTIEATARLLFN